jgi:hypothetical protein
VAGMARNTPKGKRKRPFCDFIKNEVEMILAMDDINKFALKRKTECAIDDFSG